MGGTAGLANGIIQSNAYTKQGRYQQSIQDMNAQMSKLQAADAIARGGLEANRARGRGEDVVGKQRLVLSAGGADVNSGSAAALQQGTRALSQLDALTISHNAALEAVGYNLQGINSTAQGRFAGIAGRTNAAASIATGGMKFAQGMNSAMENYNRYRPVVPVTPQYTPAYDASFNEQPSSEAMPIPQEETSFDSNTSESNWTP